MWIDDISDKLFALGGTERESRVKLAGQVTVIAGIFSLLVSLMLLLNYWRSNTADPMDSVALQALVDRLADEPDNEALKTEIRNLDLMARKAFFTSQWQVRTGGFMLLFGAILFIVALRYYHASLAAIGRPGEKVTSDPLSRLLSQRWILWAGTLMMILALLAALLSEDNIKRYQGSRQPASADSAGGGVLPAGDTIVMADTAAFLTDTSVAAPGGATAAPPTIEEIRQNHNMFRGPLGHGVTARRNIPVDWDGPGGRNILWKVPVPKAGNNSPVIWGSRLFIAGSDGKTFTVYCYDRNTGRMLWQGDKGEISGSPSVMPRVNDETGLSAPTVTTDGRQVFAIFATGDVVAFDMEGKRTWGRNLGVPDNNYGYASSLLLWKDKLYVQYDENTRARLIALDVNTGQTLWQTIRQVKASWSSPILIQAGSQYQIVMAADPKVAGYDVETGKELWSVEAISGEVGPSPAFGEGLVFTVNEYSALAAIDPVKKTVIWHDNEFLSDIPSPVCSGGLLFLATSYGVVLCYDAKTGEKYWEHQCQQGVVASPMVAGNRLYVFDWDGKGYIFEVSKEKKLLAQPVLEDRVLATPAFADGRMYIRGEENLYCIGQ